MDKTAQAYYSGTLQLGSTPLSWKYLFFGQYMLRGKCSSGTKKVTFGFYQIVNESQISVKMKAKALFTFSLVDEKGESKYI